MINYGNLFNNITVTRVGMFKFLDCILQVKKGFLFSLQIVRLEKKVPFIQFNSLFMPKNQFMKVK